MMSMAEYAQGERISFLGSLVYNAKCEGHQTKLKSLASAFVYIGLGGSLRKDVKNFPPFFISSCLHHLQNLRG